MKVKILIITMLLFVTLCGQTAFAEIDLGESLSSDDEAAFDEILEPVMNIYNFVKYIATAVAALVLVAAGVIFMISGTNAGKREMAKNMVSYVVIGLVVIWVAPLVVDFLVQ